MRVCNTLLFTGVVVMTHMVFSTTSPQIMKINTSKVIKSVGPIQQNFQRTAAPVGEIIRTIRVPAPEMQHWKLAASSPTQTNIQLQTISTTPVKPQVVQTQKHVSSILDHGISRKRIDNYEVPVLPDSMSKRRKTEKVGKGLRHFSMKVCEKVRKKGTTSYNEVADELVAEFANSDINTLAEQYDQKNIRRRVYDALNVLMAMNIISKEKKEIRWIGLPSNSVQECIQLEKEKQKKILRIKEKRKQLQKLILNQISFKNLAQRNKIMEEVHGPPAPNSFIQLPFIVVNTNKKTVIDCSISNDKMEYLFHFNDKFEIHDDVVVLQQIGMLKGLDTGDCTPEDLEKLKSLVPKCLEDYIVQLASNNGSLNNIEDQLISSSPGPSNATLSAEDLVEAQLDEDNSRQSSSCDPLSPSTHYSDDDGDSDMSSDDIN
ncbi:hypothetical protein AMK59_2521 [Oryctes borbonicus]|uniref:E2F/DP family winged-helix DNA-binding domain-containing protein n=1 Tax=Oryctes borbonicus TaxID=1629725 RepID=A0A0T6BG24_9SCAR|nr:hypothetical protein AMK59_2521 [Oryctes borbonicus]